MIYFIDYGIVDKYMICYYVIFEVFKEFYLVNEYKKI